jgi:myotubularin-related protein 6/7/8
MHVGSVERLPTLGSGWPLQIHGKNFLNVTFVIPKERDCLDIYASLLRLSQPGLS